MLVAETLVPLGNEPSLIKDIDVVMLAVTGGLERTEAQYASLFEAADLRLEQVIQTPGPISILEAQRAMRLSCLVIPLRKNSPAQFPAAHSTASAPAGMRMGLAGSFTARHTASATSCAVVIGPGWAKRAKRVFTWSP